MCYDPHHLPLSFLAECAGQAASSLYDLHFLFGQKRIICEGDGFNGGQNGGMVSGQHLVTLSLDT